jgi:hypothetical protein
LDVLAATHASAGKFSEAEQLAQRAQQAAVAANKGDLVRQIDERLRLYRMRTPYYQDSARAAELKPALKGRAAP